MQPKSQVKILTTLTRSAEKNRKVAKIYNSEKVRKNAKNQLKRGYNR